MNSKSQQYSRLHSLLPFLPYMHWPVHGTVGELVHTAVSLGMDLWTQPVVSAYGAYEALPLIDMISIALSE